MVAPYPHEFVAGRIGLVQKANALFGQYGWLARLSDEMANDVDIKLKRLGQFATHCRNYRTLVDDLQSTRNGARTAVESVFRNNDIEWATRAAMVADLRAVYDGAGVILPWIETTYPEIRQGWASAGLDANFQPIEVFPTIAKSAEFATRIAEFRGIFGSKE